MQQLTAPLQLSATATNNGETHDDDDGVRCLMSFQELVITQRVSVNVYERTQVPGNCERSVAENWRSSSVPQSISLLVLEY